MATNIMAQFHEIAAANSQIHLLNVYKGLPLSFEAKIVGISDFSLRVLADKFQVVCMYIEKKALLQSNLLPDILQAEVSDLDPVDQIATLTNFRAVGSGIGNRTLVRVQPKESMEGKIQDDLRKCIVRGELADISQEGLAVYLTKEDYSGRQFYSGARISITITLPGEYIVNPPKTSSQAAANPTDRFSRERVRFMPATEKNMRAPSPVVDGEIYGRLTNPKVEIHTVVVNVRFEENYDRYRVGMRILPNEPPRPLIAQFITNRQSEIIREIRALYDLIAKGSDK